jgi:hypothetical protein
MLPNGTFNQPSSQGMHISQISLPNEEEEISLFWI